MDAIKPKHDLRYISDISNLVGLIVLKIKTEFKNVDLKTLKNDAELIFYIMRLIEAGSIEDKIISKKLLHKLDKNKLVLDICEAMFGTLTEDDKKEIDEKINIALNHKLVSRKGFFFRSVRKLSKSLGNLLVI